MLFMESASVLVVEDDTDLREGVIALLESEGLTAIGASDGEEALHILHDRFMPSVIVMDLSMPRMDGWRFRVQQTRDPRLAGIPVVIVSGHWNAAEAGRILGAMAVVPKPPDVDKLLAAIEHACVRCETASDSRPIGRPEERR
jgi:CheY-like chemotaxis protein